MGILATGTMHGSTRGVSFLVECLLLEAWRILDGLKSAPLKALKAVDQRFHKMFIVYAAPFRSHSFKFFSGRLTNIVCASENNRHLL
jgi:hypothetical protein